eukprot:4909556-Alexandrium_andersonii.AAC.1
MRSTFGFGVAPPPPRPRPFCLAAPAVLPPEESDAEPGHSRAILAVLGVMPGNRPAVPGPSKPSFEVRPSS